MRRQKGRGTKLRGYLRGEMKDAEFRRLYREAGVALRVSLEIAREREQAKMSQHKLARALKTKQQTISRIESGNQNLTLETLEKIARAFDRELQIQFVARTKE